MTSEMLMGCLPEGVLIRVAGRGTLNESPAFRAAADAALSAGHLVCDVTACEYLDSTFLGCLVGVRKASLERGAKFVIAADEQTRRKLFSTSSLDKFFEFVDSAPQPSGELLPIENDTLDTAELSRHVLTCHERLADHGGKDADAFRRVAERLAAELTRRS